VNKKQDILDIYVKQVEDIREAGTFKGEAPIASAQGAKVLLEDGLSGLHHRFEGPRPLYLSGPCCDPYEACEMIDTLNQIAGEECFGLCLDTGHLNLAKRRMRPYIDIVGNRIKALHVHDSNCAQDDHFVPEMGTIDWDEFIEGLRAIGYRGNINAHSGENSSVAFGTKLQNLFTGLQTHTRFNRVGDTRVLQFLEQLFPVAFLEGISIFAMSQIPEGLLISVIVVMCMGINDHGYPSSYL
jgi:hypothetical protein